MDMDKTSSESAKVRRWGSRNPPVLFLIGCVEGGDARPLNHHPAVSWSLLH